MKNVSFLSENFQFLEVKFSIYLNRRVFIMKCIYDTLYHAKLKIYIKYVVLVPNFHRNFKYYPQYIKQTKHNKEKQKAKWAAAEAQLAFFINLQRAVIGSSAPLTGR